MAKNLPAAALTILVLVFMAGAVHADEPAAEEGYAFPDLKPGISGLAGYRFVGLKGSGQAAEYEYLRDAPSLGAELRTFRFPHRFHLYFDARNVKDYFGDLSYAYRDIVLFRGIFRGLYHNLDNIRLTDLDTSTASPGVSVRDASVRYGTELNMNNFFLRFKTPDYPFHVYLDGGYLIKHGLQQQRSLLGSGSFNDILRTSQERDTDWTTRNITLGFNSHLGPLEADLSHTEKRFDAGRSNLLFDNYTPVIGPPARAEGLYPNSLIPELRGSSNTLKLHTSSTGGLVASATFSKMDRDNRSSGAASDYLAGAGELVWTASRNLSIFIRYRHREISIDNPGTVTLADRSNPANSYTYTVGPSISSITDTVSASMRYRPLKGVSLRTEYNYDDTRRDKADTLKLPEETQKHTAALAADLRVARGLSVLARYTHREVSDPAYNIDPDRSDEGRVSISWAPLPQLSGQISYNISMEKRDDLHFLEADGSLTRGNKREVKRDRLTGSLTLMLVRDVAVTGSYGYIHNKTQQDIEYHDTVGAAHIGPFVPYKDMAHSYELDISYLPAANISLSGGVSHTVSSGSFFPASADLLLPASVASFSRLKMRETAVSANGEYRFRGGIDAGVQYRYSDFRDVLENSHDDVESGKAHIVLMTLSKKW